MNIWDYRLIEAVKGGDVEKVETCLSKGANIEYKGLLETPLLVAVRNGDYEMVKMLISKGADVNSRSFGTTPLIETILFGRRKDLEKNMIVNILSDEHYEVLLNLLDNNADIHVEDAEGKNAIYHMIECGLVEVLEDAMKQLGKLTEEELVEMVYNVHNDILKSRPRNFECVHNSRGFENEVSCR